MGVSKLRHFGSFERHFALPEGGLVQPPVADREIGVGSTKME
jgi:hypothetical protein